MKKIFLMLCLALPLGFVSCGDDDDEVNTHTDASQYVSGTFQGTMVNADGEVVASDVVVTATHYDVASTQAVKVTITAASIDMNQEAIFNVAKAGNNRYALSSGSISTKTDEAIKNSGGVLDGSTLTMYLTLNSKYRFSTATAAKYYTLTLTKSGN